MSKNWGGNDKISEIVKNNIYVVDINNESVEITKLSLFLKLVRDETKLIDLSENIKTGNSLIRKGYFESGKAVNPKTGFKRL